MAIIIFIHLFHITVLTTDVGNKKLQLIVIGRGRSKGSCLILIVVLLSLVVLHYHDDCSVMILIHTGT